MFASACYGTWVVVAKATTISIFRLIVRKKRGVGYFRFRYILIPSISCMYVNPFSKRSVASLIVVAVLQVY